MLAGGNIGELLACSTGPLNFDDARLSVFAEAERQREVACGAVARAAVDGLPLRAAGAGDAHDGADRAAIGLASDQLQLQPVVAIAAVVAIKIRGAVVGGD